MHSLAIRAVLFDKDGTLVDFDATWQHAYRTAAAEVAALARRPVSAEQLLLAGGMDARSGRFPARSVLACGTTPEIAALWGAAAGLDDVEALAGRLEASFARDAGDHPVGVDGLEVALDRLQAAGLQLGVATMDSLAIAERNLGLLGIRQRFGFVCGHDSGHGHKPGPGMVQAFCAHLGLAPRSVLVVGDSPHDIGMGRSAGAARVLGVLTGTGTRTELAADTDAVLDSVAALPDWLGLPG